MLLKLMVHSQQIWGIRWLPVVVLHVSSSLSLSFHTLGWTEAWVRLLQHLSHFMWMTLFLYTVASPKWVFVSLCCSSNTFWVSLSSSSVSIQIIYYVWKITHRNHHTICCSSIQMNLNMFINDLIVLNWDEFQLITFFFFLLMWSTNMPPLESL